PVRHPGVLPRSALILLPAVFPHYPPPPVTYTLSLHDALPIFLGTAIRFRVLPSPNETAAHRQERHSGTLVGGRCRNRPRAHSLRSEEHTSELQSLAYLVCRLPLEKKNKRPPQTDITTQSTAQC